MRWSPVPSRALFVTLTTLCALALATPSAHAQVFGIWSDPAPTPTGEMTLSGHFLAGDLTGVMGNWRYGLNSRADFGVQLGIPDFDGAFGLAADYRYQIAPASPSFPMDLAAFGAFGYWDVGDQGGQDLGLSFQFYDFGAIASKTITTSSGRGLTPYGGLSLSITRLSADEITIQVGPFSQTVGGSTTDTEFALRGGVWFPLPNGVDLNGELNLGSGDRVYVSFGAGIGL